MNKASVTRLLIQWRGGDAEALERLTVALYDELRRLAHFQMREERGGHVLQTTALVHEAYLRLVDLEVPWRDRAHFLKVAARQMRRILVDDARKRLAAKRGAGADALPLDSINVASEPTFEILALDDALGRLAKHDARKAQVVELRFFGGLQLAEIAKVVEVSRATVERDLIMAKAWLKSAMKAGAGS
ncbi:MAG: sigma-70 family RNA polymerase sigma factor [Acidobacteriota bacterium]